MILVANYCELNYTHLEILRWSTTAKDNAAMHSGQGNIPYNNVQPNLAYPDTEMCGIQFNMDILVGYGHFVDLIICILIFDMVFESFEKIQSSAAHQFFENRGLCHLSASALQLIL